MKAVVIHPERRAQEKLTSWLDGRGHDVLAAEPHFTFWSAILAEHEPDLVLLGGATERADIKMAQMSFPACEFVLVDEPGWKEAVSGAEKALASRQARFRRMSERRLVIQDAGYDFSPHSKKLHRPVREPGWEEIAKRQEGLFVLQLQVAAAGGHEKAKRYYSVLQRFHRSLLHECAYRLGHGSYKIAWLREEIARWATVLCHYLPDAEISACPPPQNASPEIIFLHHKMPATSLYPLGCVLRYGVTRAISDQLYRAAEWSFSGESEHELAGIGFRLFGINSYLAEIARAQIVCMDQFLAPDSEFHRSPEVRRDLDRAMGAILEFWAWDWLLDSDLRDITEQVLSGKTRVEYEIHPFLPTFRQFREIVRKATEPTP